ncbi:MAG: response regulator [Lachnospiraceae bacterium]|nr:response regulator [Lachnospiraceae bacterium]
MGQEKDEKEVFNTAHMTILICFTVLSVILIFESLLMSWEKWAIILILAGITLAWTIHIQQSLPATSRLWVYSVLMMIIYFFYGTHPTSTFDAALIMVLVIMIFTMTGMKSLNILCLTTFYVTFAFDIFTMIGEGEEFDSLVISRAILHVVVVTIAGWVGRIIIDNWSKVLGKSRVEIEELKSATERLDNFLANVSHEIRTPVNAVMGLSAVLEKEELPDAVIANIKAISGAGHRVSEQIGDILDFTEIDMGKLTVTSETYMINSLVNDLLVQLSFAEDYGLELVIDMDPSIPASLVGDASKIKKILWHLIGNGYKFTKDGGVYVHIYPLKRDYGINLVLEVVDTGVGMSDLEIERAYEKFYQSDSGKTRTAGGLGLGIPIVNGFTRAMGGVFAIESAEDEGTVIRVSIPQEVDDPAPCISVKDRDNCVVVGYLGFMTTGHQGVREFYMKEIANMVRGLGVPFKRVQSKEELEKAIDSERVTHVFIGTGEYLENREYVDRIAGEMNVAVVADRDFHGEVGRSVSLLPKPFYGGQVANFLNHAFDGAKSNSDEKMMCPGLKALVVDDEPMNLLVARGIFETYGMIVSTASGGREAIEMCSSEDYGIIFMDHMMPEMDGVEAMKRLRLNASRMHKELCIVALTANAISSAKEMFLSEGFDGFIPKPIEITEFERVLKRVLPKSAIIFEKAGDADKTGTAVKVKNSNVITAGLSEKKDTHEEQFGKYSALTKVGVDIAQGLRYCNNDEEFYGQLLAEYARNSESKISEVKSLFDSENWHDYSIRVHAIKSTSKMIGAKAVSDMAKQLEDLSKKSDEPSIRRCHPEFLPRYEELLNAINASLDLSPAKEDASADEILEFEPEDADVLEFAPEEKS